MTEDAQPQPIDQYLKGCEILDEEIGKMMVKASSLAKLTQNIICTTPSPDRNKVLAAFMFVKSMRSAVTRIENSLKEVQKLDQNVILAMLQNEELDNFSHANKLFYPSSTTRFNVSDRQTLENYVTSLGEEGLQIFGNTLNSEYIKNYIEANTTKDEEGNDIVPPPPAGVGTHTTTTLNMKAKA